MRPEHWEVGHLWIENDSYLRLEHSRSQTHYLCIADMHAFQGSTGNPVSCFYSVCRPQVFLPHLKYVVLL